MTREEAKEALSVLKIYDNQWLREAIDMAIEALLADTVDVNEVTIKYRPKVVRCKDCKWYEQKQKNLPYAVKKRYCNRSCTLATKEDDFCSYGERREE